MNKARLKINDTYSVVNADDFEIMRDKSPNLVDHLFCMGCNARVTFTKEHMRNGKKISAVFRDIQTQKHEVNCSLKSEYCNSRTGRNGVENSTTVIKYDGLIDMFRRVRGKDEEPPEASEDKDSKNAAGSNSKYSSRSGSLNIRKSGLINILSKLINGHDIAYIELDNKVYDVIKICDISEDDIGQNNAYWGKFNLFSPSDDKYYIAVSNEFRPVDGITIRVNKTLHDLIQNNLKKDDKYFLLLTGKISFNTAENAKNRFYIFAGEKSKICFI